MCGMGVKLSDQALEEIKSRTDLCEIVSSHGVEVRSMRGGHWACCPFHHEKTPSFKIDPDKGFYYCFGCQKHGDAITFLQEMDGLSFMDAVSNLADRCGVRLDLAADDPEYALRKRLLALMAGMAEFYGRSLGSLSEAKIARDYLAARDLPEDAVRDFSIGYAPDGAAKVLEWAKKNSFTVDELDAAGIMKKGSRPGEAPYHRFSGRLMFTIRDRQGRAVAFSGRQLVENRNSGKYVNSPETAIFKKSAVLFGFDRAAGNIARAPRREAIVCEGQIDTIRLHVCGFPTAVASQGTAFTETHARMLSRVADAAFLVFDDDAAGHKATIKTAAHLLAQGMPVRAVSLPDGHDPDSFLRERGADAFRECLAKAESIVSYQIRTARLEEENPDGVEAVARIAKSVLSTIGACPNAVMKAKMTEEAASLLRLPVAAVTEELSKAGAAGRAAPAAASPPKASPSREIVPKAEDAGRAAKPSTLEMSFMKFLFSSPRGETLKDSVSRLFPPEAFAHWFTRSFVEAWLRENAGDEGAFAGFQCSLDSVSAPWLDEIIETSRALARAHDDETSSVREFARGVWRAKAISERDAIPVRGGDGADMKRLEYTLLAKRLATAPWKAAEEAMAQMMKTSMKGEQKWT